MKLYCENCDFVDSCDEKRKGFFSNPKAVYTVCYQKRIDGNHSERALEKAAEANGSLVVKSETA